MPTSKYTLNANYTDATDAARKGKSNWLKTTANITGCGAVISATGSATSIAGGSSHGPDGTTEKTFSDFLVPSLANGSLIGRIDKGAPFLIGSSCTLPASAGGRLYVGYNDSISTDNSSSFDITVEPNL